MNPPADKSSAAQFSPMESQKLSSVTTARAVPHAGTSPVGGSSTPADTANWVRSRALFPGLLAGIGMWMLPITLLLVGVYLVIVYPPISRAGNEQMLPTPVADPSHMITPTLSVTATPRTLPGMSATATAAPAVAPTATAYLTATATATATTMPQVSPTAAATANATPDPSPDPTVPPAFTP